MPRGMYLRTDEHKKKNSVAMLGKKNALGCYRSEETRKRISRAKKGVPRSEETKDKISEMLKGRILSEEHKRNLSSSRIGNKNTLGFRHSEESKRKMSKLRSLETRKKMSKPKSLEARERMSREQSGRSLSSETRERMSRSRIRYMKENSIPRPTKPEIALSQLLEEIFPGEYKYVGNGQIWIDRQNPDFLNIDGQKKLMEIFGSYYKKKDYGNIENYVRIRGDHFARYGFRTLFVLDEELGDKTQLIEKIADFNKR